MIVIYGALAVIGLFVVAGLRREIKRIGTHRIVWRWFTGQTVTGVHHTNAGVFRRATRVMHPSGYASKWAHMPRAHRAGIRTGSTLTIGAISYGVVKARNLTIVCLISAVGLALTITAIIIVRKLRTWQNDRVIVTPLAEAMAPLLQIPSVETQRAINLPPSFTTVKSGEIGRVILPAPFRADPSQRATVEHLIRTRLPVDVDFTWHTKQTPQVLGILAAPKPPKFVPLSDLAKEFYGYPQGKLLLGLDNRGDPFCWDLNGHDDPHALASVASGKGKSSWLQSIAAQILAKKGTVTGIDPKMSSLDPLAGVPGFTLAANPRDMEEMWDAIKAFHAGMISRLEQLKADPTVQFDVDMLLLDEGNAFAAMSRNYWRNIKKTSEPATAPIWGTVAEILYMGRQVRKHAVIVGQRMSDQATGGIGLRSSTGFKAIAGFGAKEWALVMGTYPVPRSQRQRGRWLYNDGTQEIGTWVQNAYGEPAYIRELAMSGHASREGLKVA